MTRVVVHHRLLRDRARPPLARVPRLARHAGAVAVEPLQEQVVDRRVVVEPVLLQRLKPTRDTGLAGDEVYLETRFT